MYRHNKPFKTGGADACDICFLNILQKAMLLRLQNCI